MAANGGIHSPRFYVNADGTVGIRSNTTGQRIEINSAENNICFYNSANKLVFRLDDGIVLSYPGLRITSPSDSSVFTTLYEQGLLINSGSYERIRLIYAAGNSYFNMDNLTYKGDTSGDWREVHYQPSTGQIYAKS